jgi:CheY-like chemotaxis protein
MSAWKTTAEPRWVLVVDDDADIREVLGLLLSGSGYDTVMAADGLEAWEKIRAHGRPGLVLLDLRMPGLSGDELARRMQSDRMLAATPIVVLSGDVRALDTAESLGVSTWLRKPVEADQLLAVVDRYVRPVTRPTARP